MSDRNGPDWFGVGMLVGVMSLVAALAIVLTTLIVHVSSNDRAKIDRDRAVKTECLKQGKSIIRGDCIKLAS